MPVVPLRLLHLLRKRGTCSSTCRISNSDNAKGQEIKQALGAHYRSKPGSRLGKCDYTIMKELQEIILVFFILNTGPPECLWFWQIQPCYYTSQVPISLFHAIESEYRGVNKGLYVMLSRTHAGSGRKVKQQQEEISRNHVPRLFLGSVCST